MAATPHDPTRRTFRCPTCNVDETVQLAILQDPPPCWNCQQPTEPGTIRATYGDQVVAAQRERPTP